VCSVQAKPLRLAFNTWRGALADAADSLIKMHGAIATMSGGKLRAAYNTWCGRQQLAAHAFGAFERAAKQWAGGALSKGFRGWLHYVATMAALAKGTAHSRPMSPNAKRRVKWARARAPTAPTRQISADDKYQCQRALLAPHASLLLRSDGALMRIVGVHKYPEHELCTIDLVRGCETPRMLSHISPYPWPSP
jgi:hypothetical protein